MYDKPTYEIIINGISKLSATDGNEKNTSQQSTGTFGGAMYMNIIRYNWSTEETNGLIGKA